MQSQSYELNLSQLLNKKTNVEDKMNILNSIEKKTSLLRF